MGAAELDFASYRVCDEHVRNYVERPPKRGAPAIRVATRCRPHSQ
jgi:hypothetical protein